MLYPLYRLVASGYLIALMETAPPEAYMFSENTVMQNCRKHIPTEDWPVIYGGQRSHTIRTWWVLLVNVLLAFSLFCVSQNNVFSVSELQLVVTYDPLALGIIAQ